MGINTPAVSQEEVVTALAPILPRYGFDADTWFDIMLTLRVISRTGGGSSESRLFIEDISRTADAMYNRLSGASVYLGQEELDAVLGAALPTPLCAVCNGPKPASIHRDGFPGGHPYLTSSGH